MTAAVKGLPEAISEVMWHEDVASRSPSNASHPAFVDDELTAEAAEVIRSGRRGIYYVRVSNENGETVALFRGHAATVKGKWIE